MVILTEDFDRDMLQ